MTLPAVLGGPPAFPDRLRFARPLTPPLDEIVERLRPSYEPGVLTNGPLLRELEDRLADRLGVAHVIGVSSCTTGLMLTLQAIGPRSSVVLPSFTFSATAHAGGWNGLTPVFAECDPWTLQLDPADAESRLAASDAGAIIATHVFGAPAPVQALTELANRRRVPLVFDAAHGLGTMYAGRPVGGFGVAEIFSMSPTKLVVAGEGGIVATNDASLAETVRMGRDYGDPGDYNTAFPGSTRACPSSTPRWRSSRSSISTITSRPDVRSPAVTRRGWPTSPGCACRPSPRATPPTTRTSP